MERVHKLCGDHCEHAYTALRITTHGTSCTALLWGAEPDVLIASTATNAIGAERRALVLGYQCFEGRCCAAGEQETPRVHAALCKLRCLPKPRASADGSRALGPCRTRRHL